jgi:hypothetical protein
MPLAERAHLPLIFTSDEHLVAVADRWLDDSVRAAPTARHRGRIHWNRT